MSERVLSVTASSGYHLDSITHVKKYFAPVLHIIKNTRYSFLLYTNNSVTLGILYFWQLAICVVVHPFST